MAGVGSRFVDHKGPLAIFPHSTCNVEIEKRKTSPEIDACNSECLLKTTMTTTVPFLFGTNDANDN